MGLYDTGVFGIQHASPNKKMIMCVRFMQMIGNFVSYVIYIPEDVPNPFPNILHYGKFTGVDLTYFESRIFRHQW